MNRLTWLAGCVVAASASGLAHAAERQPAPMFEITPFAGYRFGGEFELEDSDTQLDLDEHGSFLIAFDLRRDEYSQYELFYARQATQLESNAEVGDLDVDVEYLHIGGTLVVSDDYAFKPYIVGTLGATRFSPSPAQASDETGFSFSLGGGVRVPVSDHFSLRLEARGYLTFVDTDTSFFCVSSGGAVCAIRASGSTFLQFDLLAGAAFAF